jgi:ribosome-binding protein aMBF1 (putative translation factor)
MPSTGSTDMATASEGRPKSGPGSEARADDPTRPITDALLSAIADSGLSDFELARAIGVSENSIRLFVRHERDLLLSSADKFLNHFGLTVRDARDDGPRARPEPTKRPFTDALLSAIADSGLSGSKLARKSGVPAPCIHRFIRQVADLKLKSGEALAVVLGLTVRDARDDGPRARPEPTKRPFTDALLSAIADSGLTAFAVARDSGLCLHTVYDFVSGEKSLFLESAEALFVFFDLEVIRHGRRLKPDPEARADPTKRPITDALLSAIADSGLNYGQLSRESGLQRMALRRFMVHGRSLHLESADKFAVFFEIEIVRRAQRPERHAGSTDQSFTDALLSAIADSGLTGRELARKSGVPSQVIDRFVAGKQSPRFSSAIKLAEALGLELEPAKILARPDAPPPSAAGPIPATPDPATNKDISIDRHRPPVTWVGTREQLEREIEAIEGEACRKAFRALLAAALEDPPRRLTRNDLRTESRVGNADGLIRKLAASGSRLGNAIDSPGPGSHRKTGLLIKLVKHQQ